MAKEKLLKVTLRKSLIGRKPKHVKTAHALGLRKIDQSREFKDNACVRGMVNSINYLLEVEEVA